MQEALGPSCSWERRHKASGTGSHREEGAFALRNRAVRGGVCGACGGHDRRPRSGGSTSRPATGRAQPEVWPVLGDCHRA